MVRYLIIFNKFNLVKYLTNNFVIIFVDCLFNCFISQIYFDELLFNINYLLFIDLLFYVLSYDLRYLLYGALAIDLVYSCSLRILTYLCFFLYSCDFDFFDFDCLSINQLGLYHLNLNHLILHLLFD